MARQGPLRTAAVSMALAFGVGTVAGVVNEKKDYLEFRSFKNDEGGLQSPLVFNEAGFDMPTEEEIIAELPMASAAEITIIADKLNDIPDPICPDKEKPDPREVVLVGAEGAERKLCILASRISVEQEGEVVWIKAPMTVERKEGYAEADVAKSYVDQDASEEQGDAATKAGGVIVRRMVKSIDPDAYRTKNVPYQIVLGTTIETKYDDPPLVKRQESPGVQPE